MKKPVIRRRVSVAPSLSGTLRSRSQKRKNKGPGESQESRWKLSSLPEEVSGGGASFLAAKLLQAQEMERRRVARDLHDVITQELAVLILELGRLAESDGVSAESCKQIVALREYATELAREVRGLSHQLHPATLEHLGLAPALRSLGRLFGEREGVRVSFEATRVNCPLGQDAKLCMYRIAQEALQNIAKHAKATEVQMRLKTSHGRYTLEITDNGVGFDTSAARRSLGIGLASMAERAHLAQADFRVISRRGAGTTVTVGVPMGST